MLKLKLRLMKENVILYVIMMVMSFVMTSVFSQSMGGEYHPNVGIVLSPQTDVFASTLEDYKVIPVTYDEGTEMVKDREIIALIYSDKDDLNLMLLSESMETFSLEMAMQRNLELNDSITALSTYVSSQSDLNTVSLSDLKQKYYLYWETKRPIKISKFLGFGDSIEGFDTRLHYTLGMTLFFLTYSVMFTIGDFLEDKRQRTLDRMLVSPIKTRQILWSNIVPGLIIGMVQILFMVATGQYVFGIEWGNELGLVLAFSAAYIFAIAALCTLVVSIVQNISQLGVVSPIILTGMAMLGGCMWPIEIVTSKVMQFLSYLTPHRWALGALETIVSEGTVNNQVILSAVVLLAMGTLYFIIGNILIYYKSLKVN